MRSSYVTLGLLFLVGTAASVQAAGCAVDCHDNLTCGERPSGLSGSGSGGGDGGGGSSGDGPLCVPEANPDPVADACGVFVATTGNDEGAGTKAAPLATLAKALQVADGKKPIYACAQTFKGPVKLPAGAVIYGGLRCDLAWSYAGSGPPTTITAAAGAVPVTFDGGSGAATRLADVAIVAEDATAPGGSSIAAIADHASVELLRCELRAGAGADGAPGAPFVDPAHGDVAGNAGGNACTGNQVLGGAIVTNTCDDGDSWGGLGGTGVESSPTGGGSGEPADPINKGGAGETNVPCSPGGDGAEGKFGDPGAGATGLGTITKSGYLGASGQDGKPGARGHGGGGGGGAKGTTAGGACPPQAPGKGGAGGGSGGAGGCGGKGGHGGGPGGSSIALISLGATLTFGAGVTLATKDGGSGGAGGDGEVGGAGGGFGKGGVASGFAGLSGGCKGGNGGNGGNGGRGGGGGGGHSVGVAFTGDPPALIGVTLFSGAAGAGGPGDPAAAPAVTGVKANQLEFPL